MTAGHDFLDPNAEARLEKERELELKLILGSNYHGWNISENIIAEKNLSNEPWEFGYAVGRKPSVESGGERARLHLLRRKVSGRSRNVRWSGRSATASAHTSHRTTSAPCINWAAPNGMTLSFSPQFGLNDYSLPRLYRFGVSYEIDQLFSRFHRGGQ